MKTTALFFFMIFGLLTACDKTEGSFYDVEGKGKITLLEASYWQYGTHTIIIDNKLYALKSSTIDLYKYNDQTVTIAGKIVEGYPIEGGPELIEVKKIGR